MKNRILSVLLALCMVICMVPATALASDDDSVMDMKVTELIQGDRTNALYPYWVHTNGTVLKVLNSLGKTLQVVPRK